MSVVVSRPAHELGKASRHQQTWQRKKLCVSADRDYCELGVIEIYNADQSEICFEYLPKLIVSRKGEKNVWVEKTSINNRHVSG